MIGRFVLLAVLAILPPILLAALLIGTQIPLGVPGEWTWHRVGDPPTHFAHWLGPLLTGGWLILVTLGGATLISRSGRWQVILIPVLLMSIAIFQFAVIQMPREGWGMERWVSSLYWEASSGYFSVARRVGDSHEFLSRYEEWVAKGDRFHLGTHPPGLILLNRATMDFFEERPETATSLLNAAPGRLVDGLSILPPDARLTTAEQASLVAVSLLAWASLFATALPLWGLARLGGSSLAAWHAVALWGASPAAVLMIPIGDCFYPLLTATAVWLAVASVRWRLGILAVIAGVVVFIGLMMSLAFAVVGGLAAMAICLEGYHQKRIPPAIVGLLALAAGTCLPAELLASRLGLNLWNVWTINFDKHASFYDVMPRTYAKWLAVNAIEFLIVAGPACAVLAAWVGVRLGWRANTVASAPRVSLAWLVIVVALNILGKNLGEVARLWLFLTPMAALGAASHLETYPSHRSKALSAALILTSQIVLTCILVAWVEPLLPISVMRNP